MTSSIWKKSKPIRCQQLSEVSFMNTIHIVNENAPLEQFKSITFENLNLCCSFPLTLSNLLTLILALNSLYHTVSDDVIDGSCSQGCGLLCYSSAWVVLQFALHQIVFDIKKIKIRLKLINKCIWHIVNEVQLKFVFLVI